MALVPRIKIREESNSIIVENVTGNYSSSNPGGYGVQNIMPQWITETTLTFEWTDLLNPTPKAGTMDTTGVLINTGDVQQVMPYDMGISQNSFYSLKYKITYTVKGTKPNGDNFSYSTYEYFVSIAYVDCCLDTKLPKVHNVKLDNLFRDEASIEMAKLNVLRSRAKGAIRCGDLDVADRLVRHISLHCNCDC